MRGTGSGLQLPHRTVPAGRLQACGGARERRGPFKSRAQAGPGAAGARARRCAEELGAGAKVSSQLGPRAPPPPTPARGLGPALPLPQGPRPGPGPELGRAGPAVSLWRAQSNRPGRARAGTASGRGGGGAGPGVAASRGPGHLGGSPWRCRPLPDSRLPARGRGAAASPRP